MIDTFDGFQQVEAGMADGAAGNSSSVAGPSTQIIGGEREITVSNPTGMIFDSEAAVAMGLLNVQTFNGLSTVTLTWDGVGSAGLGGVDLTDGGVLTAFNLILVAADNPFDFSLTVEDTASNVSSFDGVLGPADVGQNLFRFTDFVAAGSTGANFMMINMIELEFMATTQDFAIDLLIADVPVPAALPLMMAGIAAFAFLGRRRRAV